jgi:8-oxo-dGTP pyrophosphatase MutT (NUDIX family)
MKPGQIRPLALGIFKRGTDILVFEGHDPAAGQTFYRPLGGAIKFGEYGHQALAREIQEELGVEIENLRYLGLSENIFTYDRQTGHEIALLYEGQFVDKATYDQDVMAAHEDDGSPIKVVWKPLAFFTSGHAPLYPDGLVDLLVEQDVAASEANRAGRRLASR